MPPKKEPKKLRVAAISFLNAAPLMWDFTHAPRQDALAQRYDVEFMLPNLCAERLANRTADIGLVPIAALATNPKLSVIPGVAIAALDEVRSILLVTRRGLALKDIRSVALDSTSRTSAALVKVIFSRFIGHAPKYTQHAPQLKAMLRHSDAALLIGDPALQVRHAKDCGGTTCYDLGHFWKEATGLPFVFAVWAARTAALKKVDRDSLVHDFQQSRDTGLANMETLVKEWKPRAKLSGAILREYWTRNIHYSLDGPCIEGMELFFKYASECGALPVYEDGTAFDFRG